MERQELFYKMVSCVPLEVTIVPQEHGYGSQMFRPRRRPTAFINYINIFIIIIITIIINIIIIIIIYFYYYY